ncbi:MAG TPA: DUF4139 domain-containing protein [Vicinamibacterales bacterium]|nr:DUF4139 domain-containing protein [Vicinamibacterales bacterium]
MGSRSGARIGAVAILLCGAAGAFIAVGDRTAAAAQADNSPVTATLDDQVDVAVTVYNSNIALVRDVRELALPAGAGLLHFADIAASVNPASVHFRSLTEPSRLAVLEQNYQFDLLDPPRLLRKYVGRDVRLLRTRQQGGTTVQEEVSARLLAFNDAPVWQIGNEIVTGLQAEQYRFPEIPANLHSRPTLVWQLENSGQPRHRIETSYLTGNMTWNADYVLTVGRDDARADLDGWVTVLNTSGTAYRNARLQLVAGDLHRLRQPAAEADEAFALKSLERSASMSREAFSEYHLYQLERRTTIADKETKQVAMLNGSGIPVRKRFVVNGQQFYYRNRQQPGTPLRDAVRVFYELRNDAASGLGEPMPAGVVRVYQADSKGGVHFAGEDRIGHTPADETISLEIGTAFDVVCDRRQSDFTRIADNVFEVAFELTLRNHKTAPVTVQVNEPIAGDWQIVSSTHQSRKTDAFAARFEVPVAASGESVLRYRVRVKY